MTWALQHTSPTLFVLLTIGVVWYFTRSRRQLRDLPTILSKLKKDRPSDLINYVAKEHDLLEEDSDFWRASGGLRGLWCRRQKAVALLQLCQAIAVELDLPDDALAYITRRAVLITFMCGCCLLEWPIRLFVADLPHLCARIVAQLYWSVELRAKTICYELEEVEPDLGRRIIAVI